MQLSKWSRPQSWGFLFLVFCLGLLVNVGASSEPSFEENNVLIVHDPSVYDLSDPSSVPPQISSFLSELSGYENFKLTFKTYSEESLNLFIANEPIYNHLILLPSSKKTITDKVNFNQHQLIDFINQKGNVLVVGGSDAALPNDIRSFLNQLGIYPSPQHFKLVDHFNTEDGKVKLNNDNIVNKKVFAEFPDNSFLYEGSTALLSNNELLFPIVKGSKTSFTTDNLEEPISQDKTWTFGDQGFVAAGFQALNNARLSWIGDDSLLNSDLINWTFQKRNLLKLQFVQHYNNESPEKINETLYRIKDNVIYTVGISELKDNKWVPFEINDDEDRLQLSFKMLDPYQRLNLEPLGPVASNDGELDATAFFVNFTIPDQHGMFTFELDYKRHGLSYIEDKKVVAVRHLANDEYKRSWDIPNSWVYFTSALCVAVLWGFFVLNFLFIGNTDNVKKNV